MRILEEAALVVSARRASYDSPGDNFDRIGRSWAALLSAHLGTRVDDLPPRLVALMMVSVKTCRDAYAPNHDNLVDIAGYADAADLASQQEALA
jgi:hypothetical protein